MLALPRLVISARLTRPAISGSLDVVMIEQGPAVSLRAAGKRFGTGTAVVTALDAVSVDVDRATFTAVMGPSSPRTLVPTSFSFPKPTRIIQVGESAGPQLTVAAESLRTSGVEVYGAAKGLNAQTVGDVYGQIVAGAQAGELTFDVERVPLADVESAWRRTDLRGRRLVVVP
jgi:hypothetical protein